MAQIKWSVVLDIIFNLSIFPKSKYDRHHNWVNWSSCWHIDIILIFIFSPLYFDPVDFIIYHGHHPNAHIHYHKYRSTIRCYIDGSYQWSKHSVDQSHSPFLQLCFYLLYLRITIYSNMPRPKNIIPLIIIIFNQFCHKSKAFYLLFLFSNSLNVIFFTFIFCYLLIKTIGLWLILRDDWRWWSLILALLQ